MPVTSRKISKWLSVLIALTFVASACGNNKSKSAAQTQTEAASVAHSEAAQSDTTDQTKSPKKIMAPDFTLKEVNGKSLTLSDLRGKVVVLNIWATWCPPCRKEIPDFIDLQKELGSKGLQIIGVSVDQQGMSVVKPFVKQHGMNYPVMVDNGIVSQEYGPIKYVPTTFVIDREGYIQGYAPGMLTKDILKPVLTKLLNKKADS